MAWACAARSSRAPCSLLHATRTRSTRRGGGPIALRACSRARCPRRLQRPRLYEVMDLCLECKGCKAECPQRGHGQDEVRVPPPLLQGNGLPLRNRLFATIGGSRGGARGSLRFSNWIAASRRIAGSWRSWRDRPPPPAARLPRADLHGTGFDRRGRPRRSARPPSSCSTTPFVTYNTPEIGRAAVSCSRRAAIGRAGRSEMLRPAAHLQGNAGGGPRARALQHRAPRPLGRPRSGHRGPRAVLPAHPAR